MKHRANFSIDALECRMLMSATPSPAVVADWAKLTADQKMIQADRASAHETLSHDRAAIEAAVAALKTQLQPLQQQMMTDRAAWYATIMADQKMIESTKKVDMAAVSAAEKQLKSDAENPTALPGDQAQLDAARAKSAADKETLTAQLKSDIAKAYQVVGQDEQAISAFIAGDTTVKAAKDKLAADTAAASATLKADEATLRTDYQQLKTDLAAQEKSGKGDSGTQKNPKAGVHTK